MKIEFTRCIEVEPESNSPFLSDECGSWQPRSDCVIELASAFLNVLSQEHRDLGLTARVSA